MIVGFHSPLPPARTGVADYSAALLEELRKRGTVEPDALRADVHLYHLGNNGLHWDAYQSALREPGIVVMHDAVLHHLLLGKLPHEEYVDEFVYNYGEWHRGTAERLWRERGRSGASAEYFRFPMLRRVVERARAVIVHNCGAARRVSEHVPTAHIEEIPHLWQPEPAAQSDSRSFVFAVFGYLRETKRVPTVVRAFSRVQAMAPDAQLLIAGEAASPGYERMLDEAVRAPGVARKQYLRNLMAEPVDVCINLRYPSAGETSGIAIRMMGAGRCVVVSDAEENSGYPLTGCVRVPVGVAEEDALAHAMAWLYADRSASRGIGLHAAAHIREFHSIDRVASAYWSVIHAVRG